MTPRQQRRLQQKLALKAEKRNLHPDIPPTAPASEAQTEPRASASGGLAVSEAKVQANRANAQLSHGPVTDAGKQIVSQNATRHGLTGKFHVLANESQSNYDQLLASYMRSQSPTDQEEVELVRQMAEATWLSARSVRYQNECFVSLESDSLEEQKTGQKGSDALHALPIGARSRLRPLRNRTQKA